MRRDFRAIAHRLIRNYRWVNVRRKVQDELEKAYQDGLDDAATEMETAAAELGQTIRDMGVGAAASRLAPLFSDTHRPPGLHQ